MSQKISSQQKRYIALGLFAIFALFVLYDIYHLITPKTVSAPSINIEIIEVFILLLGGAAFISLWNLTKKEERSLIQFEKMRIDRDQWKEKSSKKITDFQDYIMTHFDDWKLTASEKEVGLYLLKGLSFKDIAQIRQVSERTIRNQSMSIYAKSGLAGKHELASYFLEDLLVSRKV